MQTKQDEKKITVDSKKEMLVMKKCPVCDRRIFDKITPTTGTIALKCPHCHKSYRSTLRSDAVPITTRTAITKTERQEQQTI